MIPVPEMLRIAETNGARARGSAPVGAIAGCAEEIEKILPRARSMIVLAAPHSRSTIEPANVQVAQYGTIHAYDEAARASHAVAIWLEAPGIARLRSPPSSPSTWRRRSAGCTRRSTGTPPGSRRASADTERAGCSLPPGM